MGPWGPKWPSGALLATPGAQVAGRGPESPIFLIVRGPILSSQSQI